ncbi:MAG: AraC family transcriptional regulator [Phycisphaerae bacterium]|nr:AraC family transcriptional regulator [Phycisphaerae bacterium]
MAATEISKELIPGMSVGVEILQYLRPYVRHCGDQHRPAWRIDTRCLLDYLIVFIATGKGLFEIGGQTWDAAANDVFWIPPDTPHAMEGYAPGMDLAYVHFDLVYRPTVAHWDFSIPAGMTDLSEVSPLMHPAMTDTPFADLPGRLRAHNNLRVGQLLRDVCAEARRAQPYSMLSMSGLMTVALAEILRGRQGLAGPHGEHIPALETAAEFLRDRCHRPDVSIEQAAETAGMSDSYFRRLFFEYFGCSPRTYLQRMRIEHAKRLMTASTETLSRIARQCGFATVHSFSRAFKAVEGVTPTDYRTCGVGATHVSGRTTPYSR